MRKNLWLMIALGLLLHKANAQSQLSMEQYYYMGGGTPLNPTPVAGFQMNNGFYAEGRYNYEDINTLSFYMGKTFAKESKLSYSITAMAGAVVGNLNGGSLAANVSLGYKNFYLYTQPQYTFSLQNSINNYIFSWTDFTYSPLDWLSVGVSVQHTKPHYDIGSTEKGLVAEIAYKKWSFPIYAFNPQSADRYFVVGANLELNFRKRKVHSKKESEIPTVTPDIFASSAKENIASEPMAVKSEPDILPKVRRVNVVVKAKTDDASLTESDRIMVKTPSSVSSVSKTPIKGDEKKDAIKVGGNAVKKDNGSAVPTVAGPRKEEKQIKLPAQRAKAVLSSAEKTLEKENNTDKDLMPEKIVAKVPDNQQLYAVLIGPFQKEQDALFIKSKLSTIFNSESTLYQEGEGYKLRISGFTHQTEAGFFINRAINSGFKNPFAIMPYTNTVKNP